MILEKILKEGPVDMALSAEEAAEPTKRRVRSPSSGEATCEVWTGEDETIVGFLEAALKENGIPVRVEQYGRSAVIYAPPEDGSRAREIIQEIVEGVPPE